MQIPLSHKLILLHWGLESCLSHHESSWWFWDCWSLRGMDLLSQEMTIWSFKCSRLYRSRQESSSFTMKIIQLCFLGFLWQNLWQLLFCQTTWKCTSSISKKDYYKYSLHYFISSLSFTNWTLKGWSNLPVLHLHSLWLLLINKHKQLTAHLHRRQPFNIITCQGHSYRQNCRTTNVCSRKGFKSVISVNYQGKNMLHLIIARRSLSNCIIYQHGEFPIKQDKAYHLPTGSNRLTVWSN